MLPIRYLSVCAGIEAFSVAARGLPFAPVAFSEIESFPCAVLAHHYPDVPNLGDMTKIDGSKYRGAVDLIVGGTPCQDFSVAGKRAGMAGERGSLALVYTHLVNAVSPRWIVWENVPGVLSSNEGKDFALFVHTLGKLGYGWAYRVLDAQYFGVPQRRRRVILVGYFGDWRPAAAVLFEPGSLRGDSAPSRKARAHVTQALTESLGRGGADDNRAQGGFYVNHTIASHWNGGPHPTLSQSGKGRGGIASSDQELFTQGGAGLVWSPEIVSQAMSCKWAKGTSGPAGDEHHNLVCAPLTTKSYADNKHQESKLVVCQYGDKAGTLTSRGAEASPCADRGPTVIAFHGTQDPDVSGNITHPLGRNQGQECAIAFAERGRDAGRTLEYQEDQSYCLTNPASGGRTHSRNNLDCQMQVRRLTPRECERLQGFPDDYTAIPFRGKPAADSPRYRALGNSMAVPVVRWIAERIAAHTAHMEARQ